jgi:hypothetical protein
LLQKEKRKGTKLQPGLDGRNKKKGKRVSSKKKKSKKQRREKKKGNQPHDNTTIISIKQSVNQD